MDQSDLVVRIIRKAYHQYRYEYESLYQMAIELRATFRNTFTIFSLPTDRKVGSGIKHYPYIVESQLPEGGGHVSKNCK